MMNNKPASAALPDKGPESDGERIERIRKRIQGFVSLSTITLEVMLTNGISISGVYKTFSISNPNLGYATTEAFLILTLSDGEEKSINFLNIIDIKKQSNN